MAARGETPLCEDPRVNHSPAEASPPQRARLLPSCGGSEALRLPTERAGAVPVLPLRRCKGKLKPPALARSLGHISFIGSSSPGA